ncbi:MAG: hypothetical protein J6S14_20120, partial [Clostridia bacterium]|nr:hypothetical protein [Clostridia bacterium]
MVGDLAAKKLPAHAYTKEATFVKQFGMTGIKMNMSLVPDVSKSGIAPGLDKDGNYIWKDGQSFGSDVAIKGSGQTGFDLAIEIQNAEGYSKHCGTIAVGVSKEHITKMLGDENIRMIIPYHKSSLNHIVAMLNNIDQFTDYTGVQNTRGADGKKISGKEFNFNEALIRLGDAKLAANEYLAWCQEHNYIPKFDEFAYHENYYKLLEDFATYDNGVASPQGAVTMTFPKEGDAFGSMTELIEQGLDEDAVLEGRRDSKLSSIVDQVEAALNKKTDSAVDDLAEHGLTTANAVQDNKKYSLKDSEGNTLTKSQQDFFEKSKARDKDGNLQVFYHGTQSGGFTVFDPERSDDRTSLFFTSSLHNAASYSGTYDIHDPSTEANASAATNYGVYLNLTNPLIIYAQDSNFDEIRFFTDEMKAMSDRAKELINYGYSLDKDDPRREAALDESTEIEYALDDMDRWNGDIKDTRYAARWAKSHGYDDVIFYDLVDYADAVDVPIESATVAIAFRSDQVKSISNTKPSGDKDIRYSLKDDKGRELTTEQANYFEHSKVRDENGNLKVMYHGTQKYGFTIFDYGRQKFGLFGGGFYFTDDRTVADGYSKDSDGNAKDGSGIYVVYLNITRPIDMDAYANKERWVSAIADTFDEIPSGINKRLEELIASRSETTNGAAESIKNSDMFYIMREVMYDQELPTYDATEMAEACLRSMGYDGITHVGGGRYNFGDKNRHRVYIAFDPEQIKNVRNEKPTDHPDIRFSLKSREQLDEYIKHHGEIPKGEKPTREIHMPTKTKDNRKLSHTVRTVLEAGVTPDIAIPTIEEMAASGDFSHEVYTDKEAMADAKATIKSKGWALALSDWLDGVKKGEVSKQSTALGWTLYNNAVTSGDIETSMTILTAMVGHQRDAAQALQASRILKKLSPEGQLYQVAKSVARLQEDIDERQGKGKGKGTGGGGEARRAAEAVDDARKEAADAAEKSADGVKVKRKGNRVVIDSNQAGEPFVFEYAQKVGESLAKSLEAKRNHTEKQKTFLQQIAAELKRFASEKIPKGQKSPSLTAIDLLRDYIQNQSFYAEAWQAAQIELREKYADDEFFSEFINSGIGMDANINPQNAIFMRALVKAAADSGEGKSVLRRQSALGFTGMADTIATNLIRQTGASGEIADTIRDAAHAYVYEAISESTGDDIKLIDGAIRSAMKDIGIKIGDVVMSGTKESAQQQIVTKLVGKYGFGLAEATHTAEVVAERFGQMSKQYAENRLKSMFKERNKTQKTVEEKLEALARLGAFDVGSEYNHLAAERIFKTGTTLTVDTDLAEQFLQATTQEERDEILKEIYRDIGRQVPATFMDKWNAWRYYAMLGNIRTHVRNALGNTFFMPVVFAKDMTATAIESAVSRVTKGGIQRTKQYGSLTTKRGREILKASWADFDKVKESMGDAKYSESVNANRYIEEGRRIFKFKPLEKLRKGNSNLLESEDMLASRPHYAFAMAQYCLANNITAEQIAKGKAILPARTYAMNEAKKATYRDVNAFSQMVSGWGRSDGKNVVKKVGSAIVSGILPFRRTPANILVRGLEYSPAGLLKSLTVDLWKVKNGDKTAAEAIDNIAAGLTGTGLVGLGVLLAAEGLLRGHGGDDEDENKFDELMGHQAYALELPGGKSITLDWLAPEVLPLFIGVNLWEMTGAEHENVTLSTILGAVSNVTEPLLEMSCLQSLNDVFDSVGYATSEGLDALPAALASAATSYLTQGLPTLLGQGERSAQEDRMTTYTEKNDFLTGDMQYLLGSISAKVPVWDYNQIPYIDAWGRKETNGNTLERIGNNFLNPAYTSDVAMSDMEAELLRLYEQTGEAGVLPERAPKYFTVSGERIDLTAEQYVKYATVKGQTSYKMITDLVTSKEYKALTDAEKVKAISEVYAMANEEAKAAVSNYKPTSNKAGINPSSYAVYEAHKATAREDGKLDQSEVFDIIESMLTNGLNDDDAWALYIDEYTPTSATAASGYNKDGTMNAYGVRDAGVDIGTWLEFKENVNNLEYESGKQGARKTAFEEMLEEM